MQVNKEKTETLDKPKSKMVFPTASQMSWKRKNLLLLDSQEERLKLFPSFNKSPSEFEVHSDLYQFLKQTGWQVRGEVSTRCGGYRFDLVVFRNEDPVRIIEIKKTKASSRDDRRCLKDQLKRYRRLGLAVDAIRGGKRCRAYMKKIESIDLDIEQYIEMPEWDQ